MRGLATLTAALVVTGLLPSPSWGAEATGSAGGNFGNGGSAEGEAYTDAENGTIELDVGVVTAGEDGTDAEQPTAAPEPPEGRWISISDLIYVFDPPCVRTTWSFLPGATEAEGDAAQQVQEDLFVAEYEAYISGGAGPPPACPSGDGTPAIDPTPAIAYGDDAEALLPVADPTVAGGSAITGMRSWVDLGGSETFTDSRELDLGPFTRTATFTATATSTVDWGDGTVTTHTSRGGGYHEGEPGPEDVTHIYGDAADSVTVQVTDVWQITVSVPGLNDINLTYTADPVAISFPVREVRSTRDR